MDASQAYVGRTGDIKGALAHQKTFATFAQATGSSNEEVASVGADLAMKFGITGVKEMGDALAVLGFQGKKGAFEIKDMANTFPEMAAAAQRAGLKGVEGMKTLGGLAQIARQSTGSGAEASTALQMMLTQLIAKSGKLKSGEALDGSAVNVFEGGDATKDVRALPTVLAEVISKSHGNLQQLGELFDVRGIRAASPLVTAYKDASSSTKGTAAQKEAAGKDAVLKLIADASSAGGDFRDIQKDASDAMKAANVQFEVLTTELKAVVASELFPDFIALAKEMPALIAPVKSLAHLLVKLAETLVDHPLMGLGAILAASIAAEVLKAQLGKVLEGAVSGLTGGGYTGPKFSGGPTTAAGALSAAGTGLAVGVTLATAIFTAGVVNFENAEVNMKTAGEDLNKVRNAGVGDIEMVQKSVLEHTRKVSELENPGYGAAAANLISYGSTTDETQINTEKAFLNEMVAKLHELQSQAAKEQMEAAKALTAAAGKLGNGGNGAPPNRGNGPSPVKN